MKPFQLFFIEKNTNWDVNLWRERSNGRNKEATFFSPIIILLEMLKVRISWLESKFSTVEVAIAS